MSPNIFTVRTNKELFRSSIEHVPVVTDFLHFCFACCCFACCFVFVSLTYTHNTYASFMQFSSNLMYHCCDDDNNVVSIPVTLSVSLSYTLSAGTHSYALAPFGKTTATFAQTHEHTRRQSVKYKYHLNHLTWSMVFFLFFFFIFFLTLFYIASLAQPLCSCCFSFAFFGIWRLLAGRGLAASAVFVEYSWYYWLSTVVCCAVTQRSQWQFVVGSCVRLELVDRYSWVCGMKICRHLWQLMGIR